MTLKMNKKSLFLIQTIPDHVSMTAKLTHLYITNCNNYPPLPIALYRVSREECARLRENVP